MTTPPQPGHHSGPESEFTLDYEMPAWYRAHQAPQGAGTGVPSAEPAFAPMPPIGCRVCRVAPVASCAIRAHQGFIVLMRWHKVDGPFCAICGVALVRELTTKTLWQGWWGVGSLIVGTPFALLSNWGAYRKLRRLQPAIPVPGTRQLPLGKPVLHRPLAYVALVPLIWAATVLTHVITSAA